MNKLCNIRKSIISQHMGLLFFMAIVAVFSGSCTKEIDELTVSQSGIKFYNTGHSDKVLYVNKTKDGGFIYAGFSINGIKHTDGFLLKTDAAGNQEWYQRYGGFNYDEFRYVMQTSDGGYLAMGITNSIGKGSKDSTFTNYDYVVKMNASGTMLWEKSYWNYESVFTGAYETPAQTYLLTGHVAVNGTARIMMMEINEYGSILMGYAYGGLNLIHPNLVVSNYYHAWGNNISINPQGSILITGAMSLNGFVKDASRHVTYLMTLDRSTGTPTLLFPYYDFISEGNYRGILSAGLNNSGAGRRQAKIKTISLHDGYIIGTYIEGLDKHIYMLLIRTDWEGNIVWEKKFTGMGSAILQDFIRNSDGTYLLTGATSSQPIGIGNPEAYENLKNMLMMVDANGNMLWTEYSGSDRDISMLLASQKSADGGWYVAGKTCKNELGYDRLFTIKTTAQGKIKQE